MQEVSTPRNDGFAMPAEFDAHQATWMSWPTRESLWHGRLDDARDDWAATARAVAAFEPLVMVCAEGEAADVRRRCGAGVEALELPIDDDARLPELLASHFGIRRYRAPFVLEGGSFFVDGEGTLLTTEQCLLHPNRNPSLTREEIEEGLRSYLGVDVVIWLPHGLVEDRDTDGHIDGLAQYLRPGAVMLAIAAGSDDPNAARSTRTGRRCRRRRMRGVAPWRCSTVR